MKFTLYLDDYIIIQYFPGYGNDKERRLFFNIVGLSMMCYRLGKENKTDLGDNQLRGRIGKLLYCL